MTESDTESEARQIYDAINSLFVGKSTATLLTVLAHCIADIFAEDHFPIDGEEVTDREFLMYTLWLKKLYELNKPTNKSGVVH